MQQDVLVVGAGFAGLYAAYRFRKLGLKVKVLEAGTGVGGTWYWNRYPGARCDVPSVEYSFGFSPELEQEWHWPEVFSAQPDILNYAEHIAERFDLYPHIQFNTRVTAVDYDEKQNVWHLTTEHTEIFSAQFCVMATGCLSVPNKPQIPGQEDFSGQTLHTGLWPKDPVDLSGKRVGVIGTGSSGVQAIPELAQQAEELYVFQRSPVFTVPANRKAMRQEVEQVFKQNYRRIREMQQKNPGGVSNFRPSQANTTAPAEAAEPKLIKKLSAAERQARVKQHGLNELLTYRDVYTDIEANNIANDLFADEIRDMITDPKTAEGLVPRGYGIGCKRQVLDRDYYDTFNRDNVTLIDLRDDPIETITPTGISTSKQNIDLDVIVYATGFDAMTGALTKANITGRDGLKLTDKWQYGPQAFLGLQIAGFPNLFTVTGPGSPSVLCNMLIAIEQHINWIGDCMIHLRSNNLAGIEAREEAELEWVEHVNEVAQGTMYTTPSCNSWYLGANIPGKPRIFMPYVGGYPRYKQRCDDAAASGYSEFTLF